MKDRVKRSRYFVPAFGIALRPAASASEPLIARVLQEAAKSLTAGGIAVSECIITGKDKVVCKILAGNERFILKMPADHRARTGEANNWRMLDVLSRRSATVGIVPQRIAHGEYQAVDYFLERAVAGQPITMAMHAITRASAASKVAALLTKIHAPVPLLASIAGGSQPYGELLGLPVAKLRELGLEPSGYEKLERYLAGKLATRQWPIGLYHGDFTNDNIFISRDEISGVIDWEYASERGIPLLDALSYVESMERLCGSGMNATQNFIRLAAWDWPSEAEIDSLQSLYRRFRVDVECHETLCQLCWLQHVSNQLDTTARFDPEFMQKHIRPMLASLSAS